jgi:hypothetical protein
MGEKEFDKDTLTVREVEGVLSMVFFLYEASMMSLGKSPTKEQQIEFAKNSLDTSTKVLTEFLKHKGIKVENPVMN